MKSLRSVLAATIQGARDPRVPLNSGLSAPSEADVAGRPAHFHPSTGGRRVAMTTKCIPQLALGHEREVALHPLLTEDRLTATLLLGAGTAAGQQPHAEFQVRQRLPGRDDERLVVACRPS
jgi:hypothetical protein